MDPTTHETEETPLPDINPLRKQVQAKIKRLELHSSTGLWILALFTVLSMGAFRNFDFLPPLSEGIRAALGAGPPVKYINWALVMYGFSAIILILTHMASDNKPRGALAHFGYLGAFYLFYHFSEGLRENFWAIFVVGLTILGLQSYHVWNYYHEKIQEQREILEELDKLLD
ncbi:MAG: menaquinol oxidoreductase [Desulfuromusa sp.]|nr:menaquinol oxidoreductase [Desulfuromusa sp.]